MRSGHQEAQRIAEGRRGGTDLYATISSAVRQDRPKSRALKVSHGGRFFSCFKKMSGGAFIEKMLKGRERREDIMDICAVVARNGEPKRPFEEFIAELERERRK